MFGSRKIAIGVCVAVAILVAVLAPNLLCADTMKVMPDVTNSDKLEDKPVNGNEYIAELRQGEVAEVLIELGEVKYSTTTVRDIRVINRTDSPIVLLDYEATCRCVWLELPRTAIAAGEDAIVKFYYDSRGEFGSIGNYISISTSDSECNIAVWMGAEIE